MLSNISVYLMSIFKIPVKVGKKIGQLQRTFLWDGGGRKDHLIRWEEVCLPNKAGESWNWKTRFIKIRHFLENGCGDLCQEVAYGVLFVYNKYGLESNGWDCNPLVNSSAS